jgi:hypothetical protein
LSSALFNTYFVSAIDSARSAQQKIVRALRAPNTPTSFYEIDGNRVEVIANKPLIRAPLAYIDHRSSADIDGCWQVSRVSPIPTIPQWPAIRQVYVDRGLHREMKWTARIRGEDFAKSNFAFSIDSDQLGPDGLGSGSSDFYSKNGEVVIRQRDWTIPYAASAINKSLPHAFNVTWTLFFKCKQQDPIPLSNGTFEYRYLIASGLPTGRHALKMTIDDQDLDSIREIRVYRPPLW